MGKIDFNKSFVIFNIPTRSKKLLKIICKKIGWGNLEDYSIKSFSSYKYIYINKTSLFTFIGDPDFLNFRWDDMMCFDSYNTDSDVSQKISCSDFIKMYNIKISTKEYLGSK